MATLAADAKTIVVKVVNSCGLSFDTHFFNGQEKLQLTKMMMGQLLGKNPGNFQECMSEAPAWIQN